MDRYKDRLRRRRLTPKRLQLMCVLGIFIIFVTTVVYNLLLLRRFIVNHQNKQPHDSVIQEYYNDLYIKEMANRAYTSDWVGFTDLKDLSCDRPMTKQTVRRSSNDMIEQIPNSEYIQDYTDCSYYRQKYGYERYTKVSKEEENYPLAFIILLHKDFHQVHFLLRAIYRPHNVYCLTPDAKAEASLIDTAKSTALCLPNVLLAGQENATNNGFNRLRADLHCMRDLLQHKVKWKYVINLSGHQFPLRTNLEIVRILQGLQGTNDIKGVTGLTTSPSAYKNKNYDLIQHENTGELAKVSTNITHPAPPHGLRVVRGSAYNSFSRAFVRFVMYDNRVKDLLDWTSHVLNPDEYFWAMVNYNPSLNAPGGHSGVPSSSKPYLTMFVVWQGQHPCATKYEREICILSPADLPLLKTRFELFANKFYLQHFPSALHCLDQMIFNRSIYGYIGRMEFL